MGFFVAVRAGIRWYRRLLGGVWPRSVSGIEMRLLLMALPVALVAALVMALDVHAAREVRNQGDYLEFFVVLGVATLASTLRALEWLGVSAMDDAIERHNVAAGWAALGAMAAGTTCYAFANFGEGDTVWTTLGPAALGFVACTALWATHQWLSGASDAIAIDRDVPSGLLFAGMALGTSLFIGRSMAGDYVSVDATFGDLWQQGWPALVVVAVAVVVQRVMTLVRRGAQP